MRLRALFMRNVVDGVSVYAGRTATRAEIETLPLLTPIAKLLSG